MNHQNSQQLTIPQAISRAKKATKKGKIADAVELYNAVLAHQPNHPIAKKARLEPCILNIQSLHGCKSIFINILKRLGIQR